MRAFTTRRAAAACAVTAVLLVSLAPHADAGQTRQGSDTGVGSIVVAFQSQDGAAASLPASVASRAQSGAGREGTQSPRLYLSDDVLSGTFALTFLITERGVPKFDTFRAMNTGETTFELVYEREDEHNFPPDREQDDSELSVCFLEGCDAGVWVPDDQVVPPVTLLQLAPGQEVEIQVGLRLEPGADWTAWDGLVRLSFVHLRAAA